MKNFPPIGSKIRILKTLRRGTVATKDAILTVAERGKTLYVMDDCGGWFILCGNRAAIQYKEGISWERVTE